MKKCIKSFSDRLETKPSRCLVESRHEHRGWFMTCLYFYGFIGGIQCNVQVEQRNAEDELNACRDHLSRSVASSGRADQQVPLTKCTVKICCSIVLLHPIFILAGWLLLLSLSFESFVSFMFMPFCFPFGYIIYISTSAKPKPLLTIINHLFWN